jgi:hypothetical protein
MIGTTAVRSESPRRRRVTVAVIAASMLAVATWSVPAHATPPEHARCCLKVMTYNMYLGANLQPLFGVSDPEDVPGIVDGLWAHVKQVDFNVRAVAIARGIADAKPDVVGLQEVSVFQTAPLSNPGQLTTEYDFLQILLDELALQGSPYRAASVIDTFSRSLPSSTQWVRWTDRNAIIVRDDLTPAELTTASPMGARFATSLPVQIAGTTIGLTRGWASVDVRFQGAWLRVFDTRRSGSWRRWHLPRLTRSSSQGTSTCTQRGSVRWTSRPGTSSPARVSSTRGRSPGAASLPIRRASPMT